jgi:small nuclear ribonucleoprotein (snRNP)-like protein
LRIEYLVDLSIRVIQDGDEYQVIIECDGSTRIERAQSIDSLINIVSNDIKELLTMKENTEALKPSDCVLKGWYIRLPITKILDILAYVVKEDGENPTERLLSYLDVHGLSRSNYRVIVPTLSALGLWRQGELTREAEELGKAIINNNQDIPNQLFNIAIKNCILRDALEGLANGAPINEITKSMGLTRRDEINYTTNLLEMLMSSDGFKCLRLAKSISNYLKSGGCLAEVEPVNACIMDNVVTIFNYLINNKGFHMVGLLSDIDVNVNLSLITTQVNGDHAIIMQSNKPVGVLVGDIVVTNNNYAPKARETVDRLEPMTAKIMRSNNLSFSMVVVPIIIRDSCSRMKVYVMVGNKAGDWVARVFDLP